MGDAETRREWTQLLGSNKKRIFFPPNSSKRRHVNMYSWRFVDYNLNEWCCTFRPGWFVTEWWWMNAGCRIRSHSTRKFKKSFLIGLKQEAAAPQSWKCAVKFSVLHVTAGFSLSGATGKRCSQKAAHTLVMSSTPGIKIKDGQKRTQAIKRCVHLFNLNIHVWRRCLSRSGSLCL